MNGNNFSNEFRVCQTTGLKVHLPAQKLIWIHAVTAVVALLIGGLMAIIIAMTRWLGPLTSNDWFYRLITGHGINMLYFWIVFFEMAGVIFAATAVLGARWPGVKFSWFNYLLMLIGAVLTNVMILFKKGNDVMFTAYPPLKAHPIFYLGIILFAVGALLTLFQFMAAIVIAKKEGWHKGSLPLFTFGILIAVIIGIWTLLSGAIAYVPVFLWTIDLIPMPNVEFYRIAFWGFGHSAQQINLAAMVAIWYLLALLTTGAKPINEKFSRIAFFTYLLGINLGSVHHILVDPTLGSAYRIFNTSYLFYAATIGSLIHAVSIPAAIEKAQRLKGLTNGKFEWLTKAPWGNPGFSGLIISFVIFGFLGGVTGVLMSVEQLNLLHHNNLRVPGHFHVTVVAGTSLAFMSIAYYVIPLVLQRKLIGEKIAKIQPWFFGLGVMTFSVGMTFAGILGVPRRHFDISFRDAIFQVDSMSSGLVKGMMALVGLGAIIAFIGLFMFIIVAVLSVFFGEKVPTKMEKHTPPHPVAG